MAVLTKPKGCNYVIGNNNRNTIICSRTSKQQQMLVRSNSKMLRKNNGVSFSKYKNEVVKWMRYRKSIKIVTFQLFNEHTKKDIHYESFDCGNKRINKYLKEQSFDDVFSNTFVYIDANSGEIIAFVTLSCSSIEICDENTFAVKEKVPTVDIKYFAISKDYQHMPYGQDSSQKLSDLLFDDIIETIQGLSDKYFRAGKITLTSYKSTTSFFKRHGFKELGSSKFCSLKDGCIPLYYDLYIQEW